MDTTMLTKDGKSRKDVLYVSLVLDGESRDRLVSGCARYAPEWDGETIAEHHTIAFGAAVTEEIYRWAVENEGVGFKVYACEYGVSDKAFAVRLKTNIPCANENKHITVMMNREAGGKPVDSNYITEWHNMPVIALNGTVRFKYKS